jgi:hypothetical protein
MNFCASSPLVIVLQSELQSFSALLKGVLKLARVNTDKGNIKIALNTKPAVALKHHDVMLCPHTPMVYFYSGDFGKLFKRCFHWRMPFVR